MIELDSEALMKKRSTNKGYKSLFETFKPGDWVIRKENQKNQGNNRYEGIILSMDTDYLEVYWNKKDGAYCPDEIQEPFTNCPVDVVLQGNEKYSAIRHKK